MGGTEIMVECYIDEYGCEVRGHISEHIQRRMEAGESVKLVAELREDVDAMRWREATEKDRPRLGQARVVCRLGLACEN